MKTNQIPNFSTFGGKFRILTSSLAIALVVLASPAMVSAQDITTGLIGHWKFDDGLGTTAADSSGNNNAGTLTNGPTWGTGKIGGAVSFDGVDDFVSAPNSSLLHITSSMTLSAWIMKNSFQGDDYIIIKDTSGNYTYRFLTTGPGGCCSTQSSLMYTPGGGGGNHIAGNLSTNSWYHVSVTFDDVTDRVKIFVNGLQVSDEADAVSSWATGIGQLFIGSNKGTSSFFHGFLDEVRIYNRVLTAADVQTLYNLGSGPLDTTFPTVSITAPASGSTVSGSSVTISANASDNVEVIGVQFKLDGVNLEAEDTTSPYSITWNSTTASNGSHTLTATARDAAGNQTTSSGITITVNNPIDTTSPSTPTGLTAIAISSSQINLSWTASTDNIGVTGYRIERCPGNSCTTFTQIATPPGTSYSDTGLTASTAYRYQVRATDAAGNLSGYSSIASAATQSPPTAGTVLGNLAASMQPGEWRQLSTIGFQNGDFLEPCLDGSNIVEYADNATWDPISKQFLFLGTSHGTCYGSKFVVYRDSDNSWRSEPLPSDPAIGPGGGGPAQGGHAYHHNTINPATGDVYFIRYGGLPVYRYETNGSRAWSLHSTLPLPRGLAACCRALQYFPERNGLLYVDGSEGVWFYSDGTKQWQPIANTGVKFDASLPTLPMGLYENIAQYNPVHKIIIFGGGRGAGKIFYSMDAAGKITRMKDAPADVFIGTVYSLNSVDPVSGNYLGFLPGGIYYEYNPITDTWRQMPGTHPLTDAYGYMELAETPITTYGVNMYVMHKPAAVWIYKHASGGGTPPPSDTIAPSTPTGLDANAVSSSQINLAWTASMDNVGVTGYRVERCQGSSCTNFSQIAAPTGTLYSDTGLTANTTYTYQVRATDAAGNLSGYSGIVSATTQSSTPPSTKFVLNDRVQVTSVPLNVRATPSTSGTLLGTQATNALGTVTGGPTNADDYWWWNVNYDSGADGWSAEDFLVKYTAPPSGGGTFNIQDNTWISRSMPRYPASIDSTSKHVKWTYDSNRGVLYAWGGDYCVNDPLYPGRCASHEEFWEYDIMQDRWILLLDSATAAQAGNPRGRCISGMTYDPIRKVVWMVNGSERYNQYAAGLQSGGVWAFDPLQRRWFREGPSPMNGESSFVDVSASGVEYMAYDPVTNAIFAPARSNVQYSLNGVTVGDGISNDNWSPSSFSAYSPVFGQVSFAVDSRRNRAIVYDPYRGETWSYDLNTKQTVKLSSQALPAKAVFGMDYDVVNDVVLFFGGLDDFEGLATADYINELWIFNLSTNQWSRLSSMGGTIPNPRKGETIVYDTKNNVHIIVGGTGGFETYNDRVYLLRLNLGGTPPPTTLLGDLNNDRTVNNFDWNIMAGVWFTNDPTADINKDGIVNTADYYYIYANWGKSI